MEDCQVEAAGERGWRGVACTAREWRTRVTVATLAGQWHHPLAGAMPVSERIRQAQCTRSSWIYNNREVRETTVVRRRKYMYMSG